MFRFGGPSAHSDKGDGVARRPSLTNVAAEAHPHVDAPHLQEHENDAVLSVLMHMPSLAIFMGNLHPIGSLYDSVVDLEQAHWCQQHLADTLRSLGVKVHEVKDVLTSGCDSDIRQRIELENLAAKALKYVLDEDSDGTLVTEEESKLLGEAYKRRVLQAMSVNQLIDIVLTRPTITLSKSSINHALASECVSFRPLSNLIFTRDIQICTRKGVILARPNSPLRQPEIEVLRVCLQRLGIPVLGEIAEPATLDGGDFILAGPDLCFIGVGGRTNERAAHFLMDGDYLGTRRVAVVRDIFDRSQERLHLDFVFNFIDERVVILLEPVAQPLSPIRRLVDEYTLDASSAAAASSSSGAQASSTPRHYRLSRQGIDFHQYLLDQGYDVIVLPNRRASHPIHTLNLGGGHLVVEDEQTARVLAADSRFKGRIRILPSPHNNASCEDGPMWIGGVRCLTQVLTRKRIVDCPAEAPKTASNLPSNLIVPCARSGDQSTNTVLMVAPTAFYQNLQAAVDNYFMVSNVSLTKQQIQAAALAEFSLLHRRLCEKGVRILLHTHEAYHDTPDAVFPNNWFSTHAAGDCVTAGSKSSPRTLILYPMKAPNRRKERRRSVIASFSSHYDRVIDLSGDAEAAGLFLESTGSLVLDRVKRVAYACESERTNADLARKWAALVGYRLCLFKAVDGSGRTIYHTNIVMSMGTRVAVVCVDCVPEDGGRESLLIELAASGRELVEISMNQMMGFCGNVLELLDGNRQPLMVMSDTAYDNFTEAQRARIEALCAGGIVCADIATIEQIGGGGVRCCIGELF